MNFIPQKCHLLAGLAFMATATANAQPVVPAGFTAQQISPLLDGQIPELSAIDDPTFGTGVVTATVANGIANFRLIEPSGTLSTLAVWNQAPTNAVVVRVQHDEGQIIDGAIHATVHDISQADTHYMTIPSPGVVTQQWERTDRVWFDFAFSIGDAGNPVGAALLDIWRPSGTQLAWMDTAFGVTVTNSDSLPAGRTDTDSVGFQRDSTGLYGGGILLADTDPNTDNLSAIYELRDVGTGGTYRAIFGPVNSNTMQYGDLAIVAAGDFGGVIYVTETLTDEIQQVAPDGTHTTWATGFVGIDSLSISPDGTTMYVGDLSGVWIIRATGNQPGPVALCQEPNTTPTTPVTGDEPNSFRIIFNEPVTFADSDLTITDSSGATIGFSASGSGSQFMLIGLATPLMGDTYTVTIADTVTSVATGEPFDGDNDGFSGGDAVMTFTHRCPADQNGDGMISPTDFTAWIANFNAGCG